MQGRSFFWSANVKSPFPISSSLMIQKLEVSLDGPHQTRMWFYFPSSFKSPVSPVPVGTVGLFLNSTLTHEALRFVFCFFTPIFRWFAEQVFLNGPLSDAGPVVLSPLTAGKSGGDWLIFQHCWCWHSSQVGTGGYGRWRVELHTDRKCRIKGGCGK